MAKERARRRAEREVAAQREREHRARRRVRQERVARVRQAIGSALPDAPRRAPGLLAARRRRRIIAFVLAVIALQLVLWPFLPSWGARILALVLTLVAAPIAWVLAFGRL